MKYILHFLNNKKGSGIMTVMMAVLFLTAFGSLAMYLSYTTFQISVSDRYSKEAAYNANTCMEEVKAGIQDIVSDAIKAAYKEVMPEYIKNAGDVSNRFSEAYLDHVVDWSSGGTELFDNLEKDASDGTYSGYYNTDALENLVKEKRSTNKYTYTVDITSSGTEDDTKGIVSGDETGIVLKKIKLTFNGKDGRKSSVTTDIKIGVPNIGYLLTQYAISGIPEFTLICNEALMQGKNAELGTTFSSNNIEIEGNAYAGKICLGNDYKFNVNNSTVICKEDISIDGSGSDEPRFSVSENSTLWAGNVVIGSDSSADLLGTTYVANDLVFNGSGATAKLKNTYYGFGSSKTDASKSSSIIANRRGANLDISELNTLTLAGVSFISNSDRFASLDDLDLEGNNPFSDDYDENQITKTSSSEIRMGESLSARMNQKLYYAPSGTVSFYTVSEVNLSIDDKVYQINIPSGHYIETEEVDGVKVHKYFRLKENEDGTIEKEYLDDEQYNPQMIESKLEAGQSIITLLSREDFNKDHKFGFNTDTIPGLNKKFEDYGITLKTIYKWHDRNTVMVYNFMSFDTQEHANQFFVDYFTYTVNNGTNQVNEWLNQYIELDEGETQFVSAGSYYSDSGFSRPVAMKTNDIDILDREAGVIGRIFNCFCRTLTNVEVEPDDEKPNTKADNVFDYYVKRDKINSYFGEASVGEIDFYDKENNLLAVVIKGPYTYDSTKPDTINVIVATGDVTVSRGYKGLIICAGNIIIDSPDDSDVDIVGFKSGANKVTAAFNADNSKTTPTPSPDNIYQLKDFFYIDIATQYQSSESSAGDAWNVASLVSFENWNR